MHTYHFALLLKITKDKITCTDNWRKFFVRDITLNIKLHIKDKEHMCWFEFPKTTILTPPPNKVQTKGAKKRVRSTSNEG